MKALSLLNTPLEVLQKAMSYNTFCRILFSGPYFGRIFFFFLRGFGGGSAMGFSVLFLNWFPRETRVKKRLTVCLSRSSK